MMLCRFWTDVQLGRSVVRLMIWLALGSSHRLVKTSTQLGRSHQVEEIMICRRCTVMALLGQDSSHYPHYCFPHLGHAAMTWTDWAFDYEGSAWRYVVLVEAAYLVRSPSSCQEGQAFRLLFYSIVPMVMDFRCCVLCMLGVCSFASTPNSSRRILYRIGKLDSNE